MLPIQAKNFSLYLLRRLFILIWFFSLSILLSRFFFSIFESFGFLLTLKSTKSLHYLGLLRFKSLVFDSEPLVFFLSAFRKEPSEGRRKTNEGRRTKKALLALLSFRFLPSGERSKENFLRPSEGREKFLRLWFKVSLL